MIKDGYLYIGTSSFNIAQCKKIGHSLMMRTWKEQKLAEGIVAQAEAAIFPEALTEEEKPKSKKK